MTTYFPNLIAIQMVYQTRTTPTTDIAHPTGEYNLNFGKKRWIITLIADLFCFVKTNIDHFIIASQTERCPSVCYSHRFQPAATNDVCTL